MRTCLVLDSCAAGGWAQPPAHGVSKTGTSLKRPAPPPAPCRRYLICPIQQVCAISWHRGNAGYGREFSTAILRRWCHASQAGGTHSTNRTQHTQRAGTPPAPLHRGIVPAAGGTRRKLERNQHLLQKRVEKKFVIVHEEKDRQICLTLQF